MKKWRLLGTIMLLLLLCGCHEDTRMAELQQQYRMITSAQLSAEVVCHSASENRVFTVACSYDKEQGATTSITAPEEVKGISATVSGDRLTVTYDGTILSAGEPADICPANCLPYLLYAATDGYVTEWGTEILEDTECLRAAFDTTAGSGEKVLCTVWFDGNHLPIYAEFSQNDRVILTARMLAFESK